MAGQHRYVGPRQGGGEPLQGPGRNAARADTARVVEQLMGNKPEERYNFISERAEFVSEEGLDI